MAVVVAVTDERAQLPTKRDCSCGDAPADKTPARALLAAALALPGIIPATAIAQTAPEQSLLSVRYLDYRDWQPGADRITVRNPSFYLLTPLSDSVALEGSLVYDGISGASTLYHNTLSGASGKGGVTDYRTAGDVKITKYLDGAAVGAGAAVSAEQDYLSRSASFDWRVSSDDRNRTYALGLGVASDRINSVNGVAVNQRRDTVDVLIGVTQVLSAEAIVQSNIGYSTGHGYYSDPYKTIDFRPDHREVLAWLTRYNQHLPQFDATLNLSYRYTYDSFGTNSHTVDARWLQSLPGGWTVAPSLRYYTQRAADFYFDPPFPQGFDLGKPYSADTRLSAFGAFTPGISATKMLPDEWTLDVDFEFYRQRSGWRVGGAGSPGIEPLSARWVSLGLTKAF